MFRIVGRLWKKGGGKEASKTYRPSEGEDAQPLCVPFPLIWIGMSDQILAFLTTFKILRDENIRALFMMFKKGQSQFRMRKIYY